MRLRPDIVAFAILIAGPASAVTAQETENPAVTEARRAREAGALADAVERLRGHVTLHPGDVQARRLLAETLYWMERIPEAGAAYARALDSHPRDVRLRIDYARFLLETGRRARAVGVLEPFGAHAADLDDRERAEVETLRGTAAYWAGDLSQAERRFEVALSLDPGRAEAERQLAEIRRLAAPWIEIRPAVLDDTQPLTRWEIEAEAGWFPTPLTTLAARVVPRHLEGETVSTWVVDAELSSTAAWPRSRLEAEVGLGVSERSGSGGGAAIGRAALAVRLPREVRLRGAIERWAYLWTTASLRAPQLVESAILDLDRSDAPGWAGRGGARIDRFPDGNTVTSAFGWFLAPILVEGGGSVRLGYAFGAQDSDTTTFTTSGAYDPYYTPEDLRAHSVIAALRATLTPGITFTTDGAVAVAAEERAPELVAEVPGGPGGGGPGDGASDVRFVDRDFTPWRARTALAIEAGPRATLRIEAHHERGAFFEITRVGVGLGVRFPP